MSHVDGLQISYALDESSFDDNDNAGINLPTPPQSENPMAPAQSKALGKKGRPKRSSAGVAKTLKSRGATKAKGKREALADISNSRDIGRDIDVIDDFDELNDGATLNSPDTTQIAQEIVPKEKAAQSKVSKRESMNARRGRPPKSNIEEIPETQPDVAATSRLAKTAAATRKRPPRPTVGDVIPETQPDRMDVDDSALPDTDSIVDDNLRANDTIIGRATSMSRQRQASIPRRRAGSASDNERGGHDPTLRRKLGDVTRKLEALEVKYQNLRDIGVAEAESNFEKLKKQTEDKTKAAEELISSLRADLAVQKAAAAEAESLRNQLGTLTSQNETLTSEKKALAASLNDAQNETKALHAKLAATRSTSNPAQSAEATAQRTAGVRPILVSTAEAAKEAQKRMLKEDLYSDLTGLVLLEVRRREEEGEDVYDCIQTGRNGTLHFHLTVANPSSASNTKAPSGIAPSYEDAEFQYTPLLDEKRDKDLMDILPDYLTEEICFPRSNIAKFYSRVVDCMTKRVELIEE